MNGLSIALLLLILAGFVAALRSIWKKRDNPCGGCSGSCSSCDIAGAKKPMKRKKL